MAFPGLTDIEGRRAVALAFAVLIYALLPFHQLAIVTTRGIDTSSPIVLVLWMAICQIASGFLIDRFGLRRVVGLALVAWATTATLDAFAESRTAALSSRWLLTAAMTPLYVAPIVVIARAAPRGGVALSLGIANLMSYLWTDLALWIRMPIMALNEPQAIRSMILLVAGCAGALLAALWWNAYRRDDVFVDEAPLRDGAALSTRVHQLLIFIAVALCADVSFRLLEHHLFRFLLARTYGHRESWQWIYAVYTVALLVIGFWSDRLMRRTSFSYVARRPFVIAGFVLSIGVIAIPHTMDPQSLTMLLFILTIATVAKGLAAVAMIDAVPHEMIGRSVATFIGLTTLMFYLIELGIVTLGQKASNAPAFLYASGFVSLLGLILALPAFQGIRHSRIGR